MQLGYGKQWYQFSNAAGDGGTAELWIFDVIAWWAQSARQFRKDLADAVKGAGKLVVHVNSPGGDVMEGVTIANLIRSCSIPTEVIVEGWAASIASVIAIAAKRVLIRKTAMMMIHNPSGGVFGESKDMRKQADLLDKIAGVLAGAYQEKTGKSERKILDAMSEETWFTADEAVKWGLADAVADGTALPDGAVNCWPMEKFNFKNLRPEYVAVGSGKCFASACAGISMERKQLTRSREDAEQWLDLEGLTGGQSLRTTEDAEDLPDGLSRGKSNSRETRLVPGAILDTVRRQEACATHEEQAMEIKTVGEMRAAHGSLVAQIEAEGKASAEAAQKTAIAAAVDAALKAERERVDVILETAGPRCVDAARAEIAAGTELAGAIKKVNAARATVKETFVAGRRQAEAAVAGYGSGAGAPGREADEEEAAAANADNPKAQFDALVAEEMKTNGNKRGDAIRTVRGKHPQLHAMAFGLPDVAAKL